LSSPTLVGRGQELRLLLEAATNPPALVFVEGEAGVGKSRLVREMISEPAMGSRRVLVGHCHRLRAPFPLGPIVEALRGAGEEPPGRSLSPVVGSLAPLLPELAGMLPPQPAPVEDPRAELHRVFRAIRELLAAFGSTVCVLEDLHWADSGTLDFLAFLASQPPAGLSLVLTYRREDLPVSSGLIGLGSRLPREAVNERIELGPLGDEEVRRLTCGLLEADQVSPELARYLYEQTGGVPFVLEEVVRLLRDTDHLGIAEGGPTAQELREVGVPVVIRQSISERMGHFSDDGRLVTRAAAVLALPAGEDSIARVAGLAPLRGMRGLTEALSSALLEETPEGLYGFRHALAAQAVYDEISGPQRRRLHLRAAQALESGPGPRPAAQLAHHFEAAGRPRKSARYAEAAAEAATSAGDDRAAARLLEQALGAPALSRAARIRMAVRLGSVAFYSECPRAAIGLLEPLLEEPMPTGVRGELRFRLSQLRYSVGDDGSWREETVRAVDELRRRPELAARAMLSLAWPVTEDGKAGDDLAWLERAVQAAADADDPVLKTVVHSQRAAILLSVADPAGWDALGDVPAEGSSIEEKLALLRGCHSLSVVTLGLGYHRWAESLIAQVARLEEELDHWWFEPWSESAKVALDWRTGRWEGLQARARQLADAKSGRVVLSVGSEMIYGSLLLSRGRVEEAERIFASVLELAQAKRWMSARITASARLARIRLARGEARGAGEVAAVGLDVVERKGIWSWAREVAPVAVQALLACGERDEARDLADRFAAGLAGRDAPAARAASALCLGAVAEAEGDHHVGARFFRSAERALGELPSPYEAAEARARRGRCLLDSGDERGVDLLLGALDAYESLGASWEAGPVRAQLASRGVALPSVRRGGRRPYGEQLSPREAEVARLAGMGRKNREIAETLFLSPRTVEAHVASALRKLRVGSREALVSVGDEGGSG